MNFAIKNRTLLGFVQTEVQDGKPCGIILVHAGTHKLPEEWITAWYRSGDCQWCYGRYFPTHGEAFNDFLERAKGYFDPRRANHE